MNDQTPATGATTDRTRRGAAPATGGPGLALRGVAASPGGVAVLRDVDLVVPTGTR